MTSNSDDALSWDGDEDASSRNSALPKGWNAVGKGSDEISAADAETHVDGDAADIAAEERPPLSTAMLLVTGVVGGIYLLYAAGWIVGGLRLKPLANFFVADAMFLPWFVLAVAAPALWFLATWVLTRGRAAWIRIALLLLGVVLLVPWPFVTVGVIGA
ncbi:hypothetical protein [Microbacterium sp. NPDC087665]|uniref:hypothetical protein n=1 Tax=Microbacterium sp. NPDC087665 TaxID=3364194 RepID=UPI0037FEFB10